MYRFLLLLSLLITLSCGNSVQDDYKNDSQLFGRNDFKEKKTLIGEVIPFDKPLNPRSFRVLRDSIILVPARKNSSLKYWIEVYRFPQMELLGEILPKGKGPGEFLGARIKAQSCEDEFTIFDVVQGKIAVYHIDSVLSRFDKYVPDQIEISRDVTNMRRMDDSTYLGYNGHFINDKRYTNHVDELIRFNHEGTPIAYEELKDLNFFNFNVTGAELLISPDQSRIIVANRHIDLIKVYNREFQVVNQLWGPDQMVPQYSVRENKNLLFKGKFYDAFKNSWHTKEHIYLVYYGKEPEQDTSKDSESSQVQEYPSVEVFKLNWEGELITYYELDKFLFEISISCDEEYLYGTYVNASGESYPELVRYKL